MKKLYCVLLIAASLTEIAFAQNMVKAAGSGFINTAGEKIKNAPSAKIIGFYFSVHWCLPCRAFTPKLAEFYSALKRDGKDIEIIFVSSDNGEEEMMTYMKETSMPWLAVPYDSNASKALKEKNSAETSGPSIPAPGKKELRMDYLKAQILDLDGKVIKILFNRVVGLEQTGQGEYSARCGD